jgi:ligand-binding sensor domain-containing protein
MEQDRKISIFGSEQGLPEESWDGIQVSPEGSVWVRSPKSLYTRASAQTRFTQEKLDIASSGFWGALTLGRDGSIMVPTDRGLAIKTNAGWNVVNRLRGLRKDNTGAVLEDREGSVWIGLTGGGLARWLGKGVWESWKADDGLPSDIVWNIRRDKRGALWIATSLGLARIDGSVRTRTWTQKDGLGGDNVRWLADSLAGRDLRRFHLGSHEAGRLGPHRCHFRQDSPRRPERRASVRPGRRLCGSARSGVAANQVRLVSQ